MTNICIMAKRKVETGPTADAVKANVARVRKGQGLTLRGVSERLTSTDRQLSHNAISEIERGARRVDVDDLVALARALGVSPLTLLQPVATAPDQLVTATGAGTVAALDLWQWMRTDMPLGSEDMMENLEFQLRSKPSWAGAEVVPRRVEDPLTPEQIRQVADEVERRTRESADGDV